jgi:hypothetical protein
LELVLEAEFIEGAQWEGGEYAYSLVQQSIRLLEGQRDLSRSAYGLSRIGDPPVSRRWLTGPDRRRFAGYIVANGEHEIQLRHFEKLSQRL